MQKQTVFTNNRVRSTNIKVVIAILFVSFDVPDIVIFIIIIIIVIDIVNINVIVNINIFG